MESGEMIKLSAGVIAGMLACLSLFGASRGAEAHVNCSGKVRYLQKTVDGYFLGIRSGCSRYTRKGRRLRRRHFWRSRKTARNVWKCRTRRIKKRAVHLKREKRIRRFQISRVSSRVRKQDSGIVLMQTSASEVYLMRSRHYVHRGYMRKKRYRKKHGHRQHASRQGFAMVVNPASALAQRIYAREHVYRNRYYGAW